MVNSNIMKHVQTNIKSNDIRSLIGQKIGNHLNGLDRRKKDDNQKVLELCQIGKLLGTYFNEFNIINVTEKPDFIISNGKETIGLEHEHILDFKSKSEEGFYENICEKVELNLQQEASMPNFLFTLFLKRNLNFKINDKNKIISELTELIKTYIFTDKLRENDFVKRIYKQKHSQKAVIPNFGAYMQKEITDELIQEFITKKENKVNVYRKNSVQIQWLVLIIGNTGSSSYEVNNFTKVNIKSKFDKIFLYEDFDNKLYELK